MNPKLSKEEIDYTPLGAMIIIAIVIILAFMLGWSLST